MNAENRDNATQGRSFTGYVPVKISQSDIRPVVRAELRQIQKEIQQSLSSSRDQMTKYHFEDILSRIENILNPRS
jgi:hypothetical protein